MPTARTGLGAGAINGILYVVGGTSDGHTPAATLEASNPASNTWTTKAAPPAGVQWFSSAVADGILYTIGTRGLLSRKATYAYDPVLDAWSARTDAPGFDDSVVASLDGIVYAMGGTWAYPTLYLPFVNSEVHAFVASLRWSSSAPAVASITQQGTATPLRPGTAIIRATAGTVSCGAACATFTVSMPPTGMWLDLPRDHAIVTAGASFTMAGWALNTGSLDDRGVDGVHVYAWPAGGAPIFFGVADYGISRPDVAAIYGARFVNTGFTLTAGASLSAGQLHGSRLRAQRAERRVRRRDERGD